MDTASSTKSRFPGWLRTFFLYALIFIVTSFAANLWLTRDQAQGKAPPLDGVSINGARLAVDYASYDQPLILYFFADWCPICKFQHSVISAVGEDYPVIAIAMQSGNDAQLQQYLQEHNFTLPVINDISGSISESFGVQGVPATFVIQNDSQIAFSTRGYISQIGLLLRVWLAQLG